MSVDLQIMINRDVCILRFTVYKSLKLKWVNLREHPLILLVSPAPKTEVWQEEYGLNLPTT